VIEMKTFTQAIRLFLVLTLLTGIIYPLAVTVLGKALFPYQANGSLIEKNGRLIGSELLGQKFVSDKYFWPRPSAVDYNPLPSSGSNLGPTSQKQLDAVNVRKLALDSLNGNNMPIPSDLLFASGSGLDPEISPEAAKFQINRVSAARGLDNEQKNRLIELVEKQIKQPDLGVLGEPRINVLKLNLALDSAFVEKNG
jgi:potassium-transporting ATPase KdpC subunit